MGADVEERHWTSSIEGVPGAWLRVRFRTVDGVPTRFVVQLEFWEPVRVGDDIVVEQHQVARFDHDASGDAYHDIREDGVHLDLYDRRGEKVRVARSGFPDWPPEVAIAKCQTFLVENAESLLEWFRDESP